MHYGWVIIGTVTLVLFSCPGLARFTLTTPASVVQILVVLLNCSSNILSEFELT